VRYNGPSEKKHSRVCTNNHVLGELSLLHTGDLMLAHFIQFPPGGYGTCIEEEMKGQWCPTGLLDSEF